MEISNCSPKFWHTDQLLNATPNSRLPKRLIRRNEPQNEATDEFMPTAETAFSMMATSAFTVITGKKVTNTRKHGGSTAGCAPHRPLGRFNGGKKLQNDYFITGGTEDTTTGSVGQTYAEEAFERRFRMPRSIYNQEKHAVLEDDPQLFRFGHDAKGFLRQILNRSLLVH